MKRKPPALRNIGIDLNRRALADFACDYPVELVCGCAHRFLADFAFQGTELVYCDPPYLHATRKSARRYRYDYGEADHVALLELLGGLACQVMISGYPSALCRESFPLNRAHPERGASMAPYMLLFVATGAGHRQSG